MVGRIEAKGWVTRKADPTDRRRKLLWITPLGETVALGMKLAVGKAQERILAPLEAHERVQMLGLLTKLVSGHEDLAS